MKTKALITTSLLEKCCGQMIINLSKDCWIYKGIDFIDLPSIFRDNTVESSIPDYFENREPPIICYKYNKPIRSTIFNFNKLVATLDIDTKTPDS